MNIKREITPQAMRCLEQGCSATFETDQGTCLIVGVPLKPEEIPAEIRHRVGQGETVVQVPSALLGLPK
jgi:hypothetical protein